MVCEHRPWTSCVPGTFFAEPPAKPRSTQVFKTRGHGGGGLCILHSSGGVHISQRRKSGFWASHICLHLPTPPPAHTRPHPLTPTHTHTCPHLHLLTPAHTSTRPHPPIPTHTCPHLLTPAHTHPHLPTPAHTHTHPHLPTLAHTCPHLLTPTHTRTCSHSSTPPPAHACPHLPTPAHSHPHPHLPTLAHTCLLPLTSAHTHTCPHLHLPTLAYTCPHPLTPAHTHTRSHPPTPTPIRSYPHLHVHAEYRQRTPALHTWTRLFWTLGFCLLFTHVLCRLDASDGHSSLLQNYYKDPRGVSDCSFPCRDRGLWTFSGAACAHRCPECHTAASSHHRQLLWSSVLRQRPAQAARGPPSTHLRSPGCSGGHPTSQTSPSSTPSPSWADYPVHQRE